MFKEGGAGASVLGIAQQTFAHYEVGRARMPVSLLPTLAQIFGVAGDELLGLRNGAGKRGPAPKFQKQLERIAQLPRAAAGDDGYARRGARAGDAPLKATKKETRKSARWHSNLYCPSSASRNPFW